MSSIYLSASCQEKNIGIDGIPEEDRMQELAKDVAAILTKAGITVYLNNPAWSLNEIIEDSNRKKPDLHLSLHSNAGGGSGVETWTYKSNGTPSATFGLKLQSAVVRAIGLQSRGIKDATIMRNIGEVVNTKATAVLIELFFHDNASDVAAFTAKRQCVINAIVKTVCDWFSVKPPMSYPDLMMEFALENGWLHERRNPHAMPMWWELIAFMKNVREADKK